MEIIIASLVLIACYLIGAISFSRIVARIIKPGASLQDVEIPVQESGQTFKVTSMGGNTVSMKLGARAGCLVALLDALKVFLPTLILYFLFPNQYYFLIAAVGGFIGHCWPIYHNFKGGRGISAFYGGLLAFDPIGALVVALTSLFLGMVVLRKVKALNIMVMYTGGVVLIIPWMWLTMENPEYMIYALLINGLFFLAMAPDIQQSVKLIRKYGWENVNISMEQFPMGKSMSKMMDRLGGKKSPGEE